MLLFNFQDNMHLVGAVGIESQEDLAHDADSEFHLDFDVCKLSDRRSLLACR